MRETENVGFLGWDGYTYYSTFMHCTNSDFLIGRFVPHDTGL